VISVLHLDWQFRALEAGHASALPAQPGELGLIAPRSFIGHNSEAESSDLLHSSTVREHRLIALSRVDSPNDSARRLYAVLE
jgi:hypothetical protein